MVSSLVAPPVSLLLLFSTFTYYLLSTHAKFFFPLANIIMIISIASSTFLFSTSFLCSTLLLIYLCISAFTRSPSCSFCQALHATRLDVNPSFCKFPIRKRGENMHRMCSVPFHGLMSCLASLIRLLSLRIGTDDNAKL